MKRSHWTMKVYGAAVLGLGGVGCSTPPQTVPVIQQVVPPAPTPLAANQLGVSPYGVPPGPPTVWDKLGIGKQQREYCRRSLCASPAGAFMGAAIAPMSKLTGGIIPPFCSPVPTNAELLDPGVIGANSKVKQDKLNAEKRKKAVEELAGVDCHYWPEARDALIGALRADRNECVRHTAALVLQNGCCCTKETIEALSICASGGDSDGHPCEKSPRVRAAAAIALEQCLERACCNPCGDGGGGCAVPATPPVTDDKGGGTEKPPVKPMTETPPLPLPGKGPNADQVSWVKPGPVSDDVDPEVAARKFSKAYYEGVKKQSMETVLTRATHRLNTMPPLPLDLSVPAGHPDYEAAGVRTNAVNPDRPANLLDMINGVTPDKTAKAMAQPMPKTVVTKATAEPTLAKSVVVQTPKVIETPKPVVVEAPKPVMVEKSKTTVAIPQPMPTPAVKAEKVEKVEKIEAVSPLAMPVVQPAPKPLPIRTAMSASQVTKMLQEPSDLTELRHAIDTLTANDCKDVKLTVALLKAAEYPSDTSFRVACLKAVSRGKPKTNDVKACVERITHDNDVTVAGEAAKVLEEMKK